ncbi:hypothetical protein [Gottfriedia solisilvae]|uniref:hypothetical protein n=1 Tax=Gottfriedia solisilvae TaxID=1516104 RepID=UPI003D2EE767
MSELTTNTPLLATLFPVSPLSKVVKIDGLFVSVSAARLKLIDAVFNVLPLASVAPTNDTFSAAPAETAAAEPPAGVKLTALKATLNCLLSVFATTVKPERSIVPVVVTKFLTCVADKEVKVPNVTASEKFTYKYSAPFSVFTSVDTKVGFTVSALNSTTLENAAFVSPERSVTELAVKPTV